VPKLSFRVEHLLRARGHLGLRSIFQRLHAETVGIVVESVAPMRISTVTGGFLAYAHRVALGVPGIEVEAAVHFAEDPAMPRDRLRIGLVHHNRWLYLSHDNDVSEDEVGLIDLD
jgi:hypothetical protein